jgi:gliding motility-associated-like protein
MLKTSYMKMVLPALAVTIIIMAAMTAAAQQDRVWTFGNNAGLNFNVNPPVAVQTSISSSEGAASICDNTGNLLFYTDGSKVWDRNDDLMPNGNDLTPPALGPAATNSTSQGTVIVPMPGSGSKYYVFSLSSYETWSIGGGGGRLYYSVVDMSLNGGLGDVVTVQKSIFIDSMLSEKLAVARGNRCNLWLIVSNITPSVFKTFEITEAGINTNPVVSATGIGSPTQPAGVIVVSPDGRRLAATAAAGFGGGFNSAAVCDFDPATGMVSNPLVLLPNFGSAYGICFSPDNSKVYVGQAVPAPMLCQFDLSAGNAAAVVASKTDIAPIPLTYLKLGPDGKIYMRSPDVPAGLGGNGLAAVHNPDLAGVACNFEADAIALLPGTELVFGLSNSIQYVERDTLLAAYNISAACFATSAMLQAGNTTGWDYQWDNNAAAGPSRAVDAPGSYVVRYYTAPCTYHADTFHVTFPYGTLPLLSVRRSCKQASNGKAWITSPSWDTVTYSLTWRNNMNTVLGTDDTLTGVPAGQYTVEISTAGGCDTILQFSVSEEDFKVSFDADTLVCTSELFAFQNTSDWHFTQFSWDFGDGNTSVLPDPSHSYWLPGRKQVRLIGSGDICIDTVFKSIMVDTPFTGLQLTKERDNICTGQSISFGHLADSTMQQVDWYFDDDMRLTVLPGGLQKAFDRAGVFPVQLVARFRACPDVTAANSVTVHPLPLVDLGPDSFICLQGKPVTLYNRAENIPGSYHFEWSTGAASESIEVRHHGAYSLTLTNVFGCTTSESVMVKKDCYIDIPNAFTPNGDGINDYFFPRQMLAGRLTQFSMRVFNRWGQVVFETKNTNGRGWDGRFNDQPQPAGVYVYLIEAAIAGHISEQYQGNVTLIR